MSAVAAAALAVLRRPSLWPTAIRQIKVLAQPRWWTRPPFLPLPPRPYLRFRLETAYGDSSLAALRAHDVVAYLRWCRTWRGALRNQTLRNQTTATIP